MNKIVDFALSKGKTTLTIALLVLIAGSYSRTIIPVAADPSIQLPLVSVSVFLEKLKHLPMEVEYSDLQQRE